MLSYDNLVLEYLNAEKAYDEAKFERSKKMITKEELMKTSAEYRKAKRALDNFLINRNTDR